MSDTPKPVELEFPPVFLELTRECEIYCVAGCCGLDAFSFDDETLNGTIDTLGLEKAEAACEAGLSFADSYAHEKARCWSDQDVFNHYWTNGKSFYDWTESIVFSVLGQIEKRKTKKT